LRLSRLLALQSTVCECNNTNCAMLGRDGGAKPSPSADVRLSQD
jgi:hypothetical protein